MYRGVVFCLLVVCTVVCASAAAINLGTFAVNPQSTFLWESSNDVNVGALFLNLTCPNGVNPPTTDAQGCINAPAGTTLQIIGVGLMCYNTTCPPESSPSLGAAFDSNSTLLNSTNVPPGTVNRLTGTVASGAPTNLVSHNSFLNTWYGNVDTTIPNDFYIPVGAGITIVVPAGANFLVLGVLDSYFADNSDPSNTLAVQINKISQVVPPVPEPASIGLFAAGLAFVGLRRLRAR